MTIARWAWSEEPSSSSSMARSALTATVAFVFGAVVDQPFGAGVHRLQHFEPTRVVLGQEIDELGLQFERLTVRLAPLGLSHRVEQHIHRLRVAPVGRAGEVQRRLGQVSGLSRERAACRWSSRRRAAPVAR